MFVRRHLSTLYPMLRRHGVCQVSTPRVGTPRVDRGGVFVLEVLRINVSMRGWVQCSAVGRGAILTGSNAEILSTGLGTDPSRALGKTGCGAFGTDMARTNPLRPLEGLGTVCAVTRTDPVLS